MVAIHKPTISDIIEGSFKGVFDVIAYDIYPDRVEIVRSSLRQFSGYFNSIECNISRDMKQHYPEITVEWI